MKAFVITLKDNDYSETTADRCIKSAADHGLHVMKWYGVDKTNAQHTMENNGLEWTWAKNNTANDICPITSLKQFPYTAADIRAKIGCSMSHYLLWKKCVELDEPILILEHDAVFLRPLPDFDFKGICQINDPAGATRRGSWWSQQMINRGTEGVHEKTWIVSEKERDIPDGLAGNSAYMIKPEFALSAISKIYEIGIWPNDAFLAAQIFPMMLEEYYPFITKVKQTKSTTVE